MITKYIILCGCEPENTNPKQFNIVNWEFIISRIIRFNKTDYTNYTVINDYTCDVDLPKDAEKFNKEVFHCA